MKLVGEWVIWKRDDQKYKTTRASSGLDIICNAYCLDFNIDAEKYKSVRTFIE